MSGYSIPEGFAPEAIEASAPSAPDILDPLAFSDAFCLAKFEAAALMLAVRGYTAENKRDVRARGLERLAQDHADRIEELHRQFERMRAAA